MKTYTHSLVLRASPKQIYDTIMDSKKHSELTGDTAEIDATVGGIFSTFDGYATGKNVVLVQNKKIEQEWRGDEDGWDQKHFSKVTWELQKVPQGTKLAFTQSGIPDSAHKDISQGWEDYYWKPLIKKFGAA